MARSEKVAAVAELTERFQSSSGAVLAEYRGLTVAQLAELRHALGEQATFSVVKNTLTKLAAAEAGIATDLDALLTGRRRSPLSRATWWRRPGDCATSPGPTRRW